MNCKLPLRFDHSNWLEPLRLIIELKRRFAFRHISLECRVCLLLVFDVQVRVSDEIINPDGLLLSHMRLGDQANIRQLQGQGLRYLLLVLDCLDEIVKNLLEVKCKEDGVHVVAVLAQALQRSLWVLVNHFFGIFGVLS